MNKYFYKNGDDKVHFQKLSEYNTATFAVGTPAVAVG